MQYLYIYSKNDTKKIKLVFSSQNNFSIGYEIHQPIQSNLYVGRLVSDKKEEYTFIRVNCLDTTSKRIQAFFSKVPYIGKNSSRMECQLVIKFPNNKLLSEDEQKDLIDQINNYINNERDKTNSLFLPTYREGSRKRLPFDLLYNIVKLLLERPLIILE